MTPSFNDEHFQIHIGREGGEFYYLCVWFNFRTLTTSIIQNISKLVFVNDDYHKPPNKRPAFFR